MNLLAYILVFNLIGSIVSLVGGLLLLANKKIAYKSSHYLSSFAAGALLGAALFDLLPESIEATEELGWDLGIVFISVLGGILAFFMLERVLHWFHHHGTEEHVIKGRPIVPLVIIGDTIHNFVDGIAIAATFAISIPLGIVTTFAVGVHEIPQEVGDFGVMIRHGLSRGKVLLVNLISAAASFTGAILAFYLGTQIEGLSAVVLAISAGFFLYIALSDLIPEIHHESKKRLALLETACLLLGIGVIYCALFAVENVFHIHH